MTNRIQVFNEDHQSAIQSIQEMKKHSKIGKLVTWMLETDADPDSYLVDGKKYLSSTSSFELLIGKIYDTIEGFGDMTFVSVDGCPRILFCSNREVKYFVLNNFETCMASVGKKYDVEILDIQPNDFGELYDKYIESKSGHEDN